MKTTAVFTPIVEILLIATVFVGLFISAELKTTVMERDLHDAI